MRYTSTLVLSTLAVGQAAAAHNARHASFHARRQAEQKRGNYDAVNWEAVSYDLSGVDWDSVFNKPTATPKPEAAPSQESKPTSAAYVAPHTTAAAPKATTESTSNPIEDVVSDIMEGVESLCESLGIKSTGVNAKESNGNMWLGDDSDWKAEFINDASEDLVLFCWAANGFSGMSLNANQPAISVSIPKGKSQTVSWAKDVPSACAPAFSSSKLALFGGLDETWWEVTFGPQGAFDVSRNVNMKGTNISSKGSKCTSDMETCVFKCTDGQDSCEKGYDLFGCGAGSGGGGGYDSVMQGTGGGCAMGSDGESVKVTFS